MSGRIEEFERRGCDVLGISTDDIDTHVRWLTTNPMDGGLGPISFPLAADPDGTVCEQFGVYIKRQQVALRGLFMIDPNGVLQYQSVHSLSVGRSTDEVLRVLDAIQSGGLCPGERQVGQPTIDIMANMQSGRVLGPYRIESELGKGSFGTVFQATDTLLDRSVALKVLRSDSGEATDSLLREARAAAALNHPNVCAVHTIDTSNGAAMIVMEFVRGDTLSELLKSERLPQDRIIELSRQLAEGMASAHDAGVIHGDLKPGNVVVTPEGTAKIMDFGLSSRTRQTNVEEETLPPSGGNTSSGLSGTLGYLAPELARGDAASAASDTFALGLVIYEMLAGERAITGSNVIETLHNIEEFDAGPLLAKIPERFQPTLEKALARMPGDRLSMNELAEAMTAATT